jgi:hypothetical protein
MYDLTSDDFKGMIGQTVTVVCDDQSRVPLVVDHVNIKPKGQTPESVSTINGRIALRPEVYSVGLRGPHEPVLDQLTYPIVLPGRGEVLLFLGPYGQDETATLYEINFG